jgi:hypothetical protein
MSLSRCTECETIEGAWRKFRGSEEQMSAAGLDADDYVEECCERGAPTPPVQTHKGVDVSHLDVISYELVKEGICPGCLSLAEHCCCGVE